MMGPRQEAQSALFSNFSIEDHVPTDHVLRAIDGVIDLSSVRTHLTEFYSQTGRPSVDPELMMRMLLVGYIMGIRSERLLCEEVHLNLAYRWFCKMDLTDAVPDHSTFSKNRHGITLTTREPRVDTLRDHCREHMSQHIAVTEPAVAVL